jgi:hypothetical protein
MLPLKGHCERVSWLASRCLTAQLACAVDTVTLPSALAPRQYRATQELAALHQLGNSTWDALFGRVMPQVGALFGHVMVQASC